MAKPPQPAYHFPERSGEQELGTPFKRIVIVQLLRPNVSEAEAEDQYEEISRLVETLDGKVVGRQVQRRPHPHPQYFIGPGKADQVGTLCDNLLADTVVVDAELNPTQVANLEHETGSHIMDRSELILEIFARRARTAEAKLQVELAYLDYINPRTHKGTQYRAYRGGLRGQSESALQKKIRAGRARADILREKIAKLQRQSETRAKRRKDAWTVALVGYTNAGKSTLLNALAGECVYADDRLFATLDTTTRRVHLADNRFVLISDTVGFIRRLPHSLIASFHSTLSEALSADLLLHVVDTSSPTWEEQMESVMSTLKELKAENARVILGFNKIDLAPPDRVVHLRLVYPEALFFSAVTGEGLSDIKNRLLQAFLEPDSLQLSTVPLEAIVPPFAPFPPLDPHEILDE